MRILDDGVHIHQSDLKNHCLEKLRLDTTVPGARVENDAATVGTTMHHLIEHEASHCPFDREDDAVQWAMQHYADLVQQYETAGVPFVLSSFSSHDRAVNMIDVLARSWYRCPERDVILVEKPKIEWEFDLPFRTVNVKRSGRTTLEIPVWLAGTADVLFNNQSMLWDWKTSGSEYRGWEFQRWGRQPDVYTWAAAQQELLEPGDNGLYRFDFKVFVRRSEPTDPQTVTVYRSPNNWEWLGKIVERLVNMIYLVDLDSEWPLDDQHVLCSPKWCSHFASCKGMFINGERWT